MDYPATGDKKLKRGTQAGVLRTDTYPYLVFLPAEYDAREKWPFILFLHGAGERGQNLELVKKLGIPKIVARSPDFPFIAVSPQCPAGEYWRTDLLDSLLAMVIENYKVDKEMVYLTGVSMGGYAAWMLAIGNPGMFAAVAPVCGGGDSREVWKLKEVPVWAFHGARDAVVPLFRSEQMVDALRDSGGDVQLTVYPEAGHDSWTPTYDNPELYEWFLKHRRKS